MKFKFFIFSLSIFWGCVNNFKSNDQIIDTSYIYFLIDNNSYFFNHSPGFREHSVYFLGNIVDDKMINGLVKEINRLHCYSNKERMKFNKKADKNDLVHRMNSTEFNIFYISKNISYRIHFNWTDKNENKAFRSILSNPIIKTYTFNNSNSNCKDTQSDLPKEYYLIKINSSSICF